MALKNRLLRNCILAVVLLCILKFTIVLYTLTENIAAVSYTTTTGHGLKYTWHNRTGRPFVLTRQTNSSMADIGFPLTKYVQISKQVLEDFVFATAVSKSYVPYALDAIATIQEHFPDKKIIVFNLGQDNEDWTHQVKTLCNVVEVRSFNFKKLPKHVGKLKNCAWKILVVHTLLREYSGVFWVDSSIRFTSNDLKETFELVQSTGGVCQFISTWHSNYVVSQPVHYEYFPTDVEQQKLTEQSGAGIFLMYRTKHVYENIMKWLLLCALQEQCINAGRYECSFFLSHNRWTTNARCSRFDQSILNLLLSNYFGFNHYIYTTRTGGDKNGIFDVKRKSQGHHTPKECSVE